MEIREGVKAEDRGRFICVKGNSVCDGENDSTSCEDEKRTKGYEVDFSWQTQKKVKMP